jgi:hypothetical protein
MDDKILGSEPSETAARLGTHYLGHAVVELRFTHNPMVTCEVLSPEQAAALVRQLSAALQEHEMNKGRERRAAAYRKQDERYENEVVEALRSFGPQTASRLFARTYPTRNRDSIAYREQQRAITRLERAGRVAMQNRRLVLLARQEA